MAIELPKYKIRVKAGMEPPEDWTRVLVPFAGTSGLKILETFVNEVIIESGPITVGRIKDIFQDSLDVFEYTPGKHTEKTELETTGDEWWFGNGKK